MYARAYMRMGILHHVVSYTNAICCELSRTSFIYRSIVGSLYLRLLSLSNDLSKAKARSEYS